MEYRMIVRQTMFDFKKNEKGALTLNSVKFLRDSFMKRKNNLLLVMEQNKVQFFVGGATPVSELSKEQFRFVTAATKFFGHLPDKKQLPVWLWADSLEMQPGRCGESHVAETTIQPEPAIC